MAVRFGICKEEKGSNRRKETDLDFSHLDKRT